MRLRPSSDPRGTRCFFVALASISAACTIHCGSGGGGSGGGSSSGVDSSGIATADLEAEITVHAHEAGRVFVAATLETETVVDVEDVELSGGDSFRATSSDGQTRKLERGGSDLPRYRAEFVTSPAEGPFQVQFRGSSFTVLLRPEFSVTSPAPGDVFGFQDDLNFEWTPAQPGHVMRIWINHLCHTTTGGLFGGSFFVQVPDTGEYSYDLSLLPAATNPVVDTSQDCSLAVQLMREESTDISPPFATASEMESSQDRLIENLTITF
jgi:hypothetical protein